MIDDIFLSSLVPPKLTVERSEVVINTQSKLVIRCSTAGVPPPRLEWFKNQKKITEGGRVQIYDDGSLVITNPTTQDVGTYNCVALSSAGSASGQIDVKMPSKLEKLKIEPIICMGT